MNTDIRVNTSFYEHPKFTSLAERCGPDGCFCLIILWCAAAKTKPDGNLGKISAWNIACMARWSGEPEIFVDALLECGLLDRREDGSYQIHDWQDHNAYAACARERKEKARKASLSRKKTWSDEEDDQGDDCDFGCDETDHDENGENVQMGQNDPANRKMGQNDPANARSNARSKRANARSNARMHDQMHGQMHGKNVQMHGQMHDQNVQMHDQNVHLEKENVQTGIAKNKEDEGKQVFILDCKHDAILAQAKTKHDCDLALPPSPSPSPSPSLKDTPPDSGVGGHAPCGEKVGKTEFIQAVVDAYRSACPDLPQPREIKTNSVLYRQISGRCRGERDRRRLSWWVGYWRRVAGSGFLSGQKTDWRADAVWLTGPKNMEKVLSGNYDDRKNGPASSGVKPKGMSPVSPSGTFERVGGFFDDHKVAGC
jgi:hypothetical protein